MDLEVVTVGTELLLGFTLDSNAPDISRALGSIGVRVVRRSTVADDPVAIQGAVSEALERTGFVIITGGLGPTKDDMTKKAVAEIFHAPLDIDTQYLATLRERFARLGRGPMPASNRTQAEVPQGSVVLANRRGTAPGLWLDGAQGTAVLLPGIPREMNGIMEQEVIPRIREHLLQVGAGALVTKSRTLRTTGISESRLADQLESTAAFLDKVSLAYLPTVFGVDLRLTAWQLPPGEVEAVLEQGVKLILAGLGRDYYGEGDIDLAAVVLGRLRHENLRCSTAESCTGGLVGARMTAVPGSSEVFAGGVVAYSNESKVRELGVSASVIREHGAVSEPVARQMVDGICERFETEAGIAVTGIAGPGGGSPEKPVGTVWIAARVGEVQRSLQGWFPGGREAVRQRCAQAALDLIRRLLAN
jgi:nicotinamide-nucleotide amidase